MKAEKVSRPVLFNGKKYPASIFPWLVSCTINTALKVARTRSLGGKVNLSFDGMGWCWMCEKWTCSQLVCQHVPISCFSYSFDCVCSWPKAEVVYYESLQLHGFKSLHFQHLNPPVIVITPLRRPWHECNLKWSECFLLCPTEMEISLHLKTKVNISPFSFFPSPSLFPFSFHFITETHRATCVCVVFLL